MGDTMKFEIEIADEDCELLEKLLKIDVKKLITLLTPQIVEYLKEMAIAQKSGVPVTLEDANRIGKVAGEQVYRDAKVEPK
jgi:hypothetical protein